MVSRFSNDSLFVDKVFDVVGLCLNPPEGAVVYCVDEKSQIQALARSQPVFPMTPYMPERRTHDCLRHGVTSLFRNDGLIWLHLSLLTNTKVLPTVAMTGELSLKGRVLPIGGVKQKLLAAHRAGLTTVILPKQNEPDLDDVPANVLEGLSVHLVDDVREVLQLALCATPAGN